MKTASFSALSTVFHLLMAGAVLADCQSNSLKQEIAALSPAAGPEPSVLAITRHYARLLSQATPPPRDSLLRYGPVTAGASILPGHYQLRWRTYVVDVQPEGVMPTVTIEPPELALPAAVMPPAKLETRSTSPGTGQVGAATRSANPVLVVQLSKLTEVFGPWKGDFYIAEEEPLAPEMHPTELRYRNPTTRHGCRITVYLKNAPAAATNAVHKITLWRDNQP